MASENSTPTPSPSPSDERKKNQAFRLLVDSVKSSLSGHEDVSAVMAANRPQDAIRWLSWNLRHYALDAVCACLVSDPRAIAGASALAVQFKEQLEPLITVKALQELYPSRQVDSSTNQ